jgi:hypothetical protein
MKCQSSLLGKTQRRVWGGTEGKEESWHKKLPRRHESDDNEVTRLTDDREVRRILNISE